VVNTKDGVFQEIKNENVYKKMSFFKDFKRIIREIFREDKRHFHRRNFKRNDNSIRIFDPNGLLRRDGQSRNYHRLRKTYHRNELTNFVNGKKVKCWRIVYGADDAEGDEFVPIFYHSNRKKRFGRR